MDKQEGRRLERFVRLRWARAQGGIRGLAKETGITAETLYSWFRAATDPSIENLGVLAAALGVTRAQILAAMDGEVPIVRLDEETREAMRAELVAVLPELLESLGLQGPGQAPRAGAGGG